MRDERQISRDEKSKLIERSKEEYECVTSERGQQFFFKKDPIMEESLEVKPAKEKLKQADGTDTPSSEGSPKKKNMLEDHYD